MSVSQLSTGRYETKRRVQTYGSTKTELLHNVNHQLITKFRELWRLTITITLFQYCLLSVLCVDQHRRQIIPLYGRTSVPRKGVGEHPIVKLAVEYIAPAERRLVLIVNWYLMPAHFVGYRSKAVGQANFSPMLLSRNYTATSPRASFHAQLLSPVLLTCCFRRLVRIRTDQV